jgi:hypothetical protein
MKRPGHKTAEQGQIAQSRPESLPVVQLRDSVRECCRQIGCYDLAAPGGVFCRTHEGQFEQIARRRLHRLAKTTGEGYPRQPHGGATTP